MDSVETKTIGNCYYKEQYLIADLVSEISIILNDKATLEKEKTALHIECDALKEQCDVLEKTSSEEKSSFLLKIARIQEKLKNEQMQHQAEVNILKEEHKNEISSMKKQLQESKISYEQLKISTEKNVEKYQELQNLADILRNKYIEYKDKLRRALKIIEDLKKSPHVTLKNIDVKQKKTNIKKISPMPEQEKQEDCILAELFFNRNIQSTSEIDQIFSMFSDNH